MINTEIDDMLKSENSFENLLKELESSLGNELEIRPLRVYSCGAKGMFVDSAKGILAESCRKGDPIVIPDISQEKHFNPSLDNPENLDIKSLLTYPMEFEGKKIAIVVLWGLKSHIEEEERLVPLKSGSETIGVTVKKEKVEYPERILTQEDIKKIEFILGDLPRKIYMKYFTDNRNSEEDEYSVEIDNEEVFRIGKEDVKNESNKKISKFNKKKADTKIESSWIGKIKNIFLGRI